MDSATATMDFDDDDVSGNNCRRLEAEEGEVDNGTVMIDYDEEQGGGEEEEQEQEQWRLHSTHAAIDAALPSRNPTLVSMEVDLETTTERLSDTPSPASNTTPQTRNETIEEDPGKSPSVATPSSDDLPSSNSSDVQSHNKRFADLQTFLRVCDESDQKDHLDALRSLSAAARSGHAFNLEYRALMLSLEEGKEMFRLKMLNIMGRNKSPSPSKQETGSTPIGSRLPAPGSLTDLSAC